MERAIQKLASRINYSSICCMFLTVVFGLLAMPAYPAGTNDPLLKKLIDKGVISPVEAKEIESKGETKLPKGLRGITIGAKGYLDYSIRTDTNGNDYNRFTITRGYLTVKKTITPWFKARLTSDIKQDDKTGDMKLRMKYYYADLLPPDMAFFTSNVVRLGLGHMPWIDFEEHINIYRLQGTMFQERNHMFNSADFGMSLIGNLGGKLSHEQQEKVGYHTPYNGRFGSYHIGVYNGGGYHAAENNRNKVFEARLTIRPLPDMIPGLQFTYFGITGKGNIDGTPDPDYYVNTAFLSFQNRLVVLTCEYAKNKGKQTGTDETHKEGFSVFGNLRIPGIMKNKLALMARYDIWNPDLSAGNDKKLRTIAGVSYDLSRKSKVLVAFDGFDDKSEPKYEKKAQVILEVTY